MLKTLFLILFFNFILLPFSEGQEKKKIILAVFAHSDDEAAVGQVLAKYSKQSKVYVIYVVDVGDSSRIAGWPVGDSLKQIRRSEAICSCNKLSIEPPIFLGFDRLDGRKGPREYFLRTKELKTVLKQKIDSLNPDVLITFGPDGESGHFEHRVVSGIVTELILYNGWVDRYPLYYLARTKETEPVDQLEGTGEIDKKYLTVAIPYTDEDVATLFESLKCYKSQFRPAEIQKWKDEEAADKSNVFYFRQFTVSAKHKTNLFEK